ncbi:pseudouridine synthase [Congregibacter variabilis]|uniref:Pseudouridine synthase n=1 Tax=Congregibacter variabilis TaxID=3081200 RepID=A0ABZ0I702_9GAMM|nr:pseudouridine synthase [Congregibacter sp. IMCC43200]
MPRLDKHISNHIRSSRRSVRLMLAQGRIIVDGVVASDIAQTIDKFSRIKIDGQWTQNNTAHYLLLNKPQGVICATKDPKHRTVLDLLELPYKEQLHIVGRLDYNSTGLVLLTNDGQWSRKLSHPDSRLIKRYRVTTEQTITEHYVEAFQRGMYFGFEGITTRPVTLTILDERTAEVGLSEGRYHQIKRMFGRFNNKVLSIHRFAVGRYELGDLGCGEYRSIAPNDAACFTD